MLKILIPFLVLLFNLFVMVYLENLNRKDSITRGYTILLTVISGWFFFYIYNRSFYISRNDVFFLKIGAVTWLALGISFLNLVNKFLKVKNGKVFYFFLFLYFSVLIINMKTDCLIKSWGYDSSDSFFIKFGEYYPYIMITVVLLPVIIGLIKIHFHAKVQSDKIQKFFLKRIFIVIFIVVTFASVSDFFIPIFIDRANIPENSVLSMSVFCVFLNILLLRGFSIHRVNVLIGDFFESFRQPVLITDKNGNVIQYNREYDKFSLHMKSFFVKTLKEDFYGLFSQEFEYENNYYLIHKNEFDITQEKKGIIYIFYDITFMKLKEKKLRNENLSLEEYEQLKSSEFYEVKNKIEQNQKLYKILFENENLAIVIFDEMNGNIFSCNNCFKKIFNIKKDVVNENIQKLLKINIFKEGKLCIPKKPLKIRGLEFELKYSCIEHDNRKKIVLRFREYDINKKMQNYLMETERDNVLGIISSGLSHELNNVHTVLNGYFELLRRKYVDYTADNNNKKQIEEIERLLKRCAVLTDSLNIFSGRSDDEPEMVDLFKLLSLMQNFIDNKINITMSEQKEIKLFCTRKKLSQLILSIIKYLISIIGYDQNINIVIENKNGMVSIVFICKDLYLKLDNESVDLNVAQLILAELRGTIENEKKDNSSEIILRIPEMI